MVSAAIYTLITIVFYLLGAAILHRTRPDAANLEGLDVALALSKIFTESFGQWSFVIFMTGAFLVLYSTFVGACASWARFSADFSKKLGLISATDPAQWSWWCKWLSISLGPGRSFPAGILAHPDSGSSDSVWRSHARRVSSTAGTFSDLSVPPSRTARPARSDSRVSRASHLVDLQRHHTRGRGLHAVSADGCRLTCVWQKCSSGMPSRARLVLLA